MKITFNNACCCDDKLFSMPKNSFGKIIRAGDGFDVGDLVYRGNYCDYVFLVGRDYSIDCEFLGEARVQPIKSGEQFTITA